MLNFSLSNFTSDLCQYMNTSFAWHWSIWSDYLVFALSHSFPLHIFNVIHTTVIFPNSSIVES